MTIDAINSELEAHYNNYFPIMKIETESSLEKLSVPILMKVDKSYYDPTKPTIMVFGQEVNVWGDEKFHRYIDIEDNEREAITSIMNHYQWQLQTLKTKRSLFIKAFLKVKEELGDKYNILWNNIYKYSYDGKRTWDYIKGDDYEKILAHQQPLMKHELELFQPVGMIFFTGHGLDKAIEKNLDATISKKRIFENGSVEIELKSEFSISQNMKVFRTYHPQYLARKNNLDSILEYIKKVFLEES